MDPQTPSITVRLNGQKQSVPPGTTLADLLRCQELPADQVAVEVNRRLVRTAAYDRVLEEGDDVEIVTFVGGG